MSFQKIKVTQYMRRPGNSSYSIERLYEDVRAHIRDDIEITPCTNRFISKGFLTRLYDMLRARRWQGDVNHVTGDVHFLTYLLKKRRTILTIHDCVTLERLQGIKRFVFWFLWYWLPEKRCSVITVVSESTRKQVLYHLGCDEKKVRVVYNNVSDEFRPAMKTFTRENPRILQIGTGANKNLERVAEALSAIKCNLVIIGHLSDRQRNALNQHQISYEDYAGLTRQALLDQYRMCDMLVFASTYEGFGLPIVEANAVGRPVVTSNCWSMPEVGGNAACYVDPFDAASIRGGILQVIIDADFRDTLVRLGFENVKRFRIDNITEQYADLYRNVHERTAKRSEVQKLKSKGKW